MLLSPALGDPRTWMTELFVRSMLDPSGLSAADASSCSWRGAREGTCILHCRRGVGG